MSYHSPQTASISVVAGTTSSVTLFNQTAHTSGRMVYNDSTAVLFLAFGTAASAGSCTTAVGTAATFVFPVPVYAGQVTGAWASTAGSARTTWW